MKPQRGHRRPHAAGYANDPPRTIWLFRDYVIRALNRNVPIDRFTIEQLARWRVSDENPLTPRVIANRFWEQIFGDGIVRTSEEFGSQGELLVNRELLDWLAVELVARQWEQTSNPRPAQSPAASTGGSVSLGERDRLRAGVLPSGWFCR